MLKNLARPAAFAFFFFAALSAKEHDVEQTLKAARALAESRQYESARALLERTAKELKPEQSLDVRFLLAEVLKKSGNKKKAVSLLDALVSELLTKQEKNKLPLKERFLLEKAEKLLFSLSPLLEELKKADEEAVRRWIAVARKSALKKDYRALRYALKRIRKIDPDNPDARKLSEKLFRASGKNLEELIKDALVYARMEKDDIFTVGDKQYLRAKFFDVKNTKGGVKNVSPVKGARGGALFFNGDSFIAFPAHSGFSVSEMTVAAFCRWQEKSMDDNTGIVSNYAGGGKENHYGLRMNEKGLPVFFFDDGTKWRQVTGKTRINDGQWHFIAGVYEGGKKAVLYVDGVPEARTTEDVPEKLNAAGALFIGRDGKNEAEKRWTGAIDEVFFFNKALDAGSIRTLSRK